MRTLATLTVLIVPFAVMSLRPDNRSNEKAQTKASSTSKSKAVHEDLKESLAKLEKQSWEAWKNRDGKFFQEFLTDDHVEVSFRGLTNKASVVAGVSSPSCVVKSYSVENFTVTSFSENAAVLNYHAAQDTLCNGAAVPSPVWVSSLYVKRGGRWLNALYQQSQDLRK
ncbi:MAG: nuclear transport factor 2 family protein [Acidobacteria bacterium]|nr:nuclear transport factor 2 family protein [Acidobacteriota bacterium]